MQCASLALATRQSNLSVRHDVHIVRGLSAAGVTVDGSAGKARLTIRLVASQACHLYAAALRQRAFDVAGGIAAPQPADSDSYYEDSYAGVPPLDPASTVTPYSLAARLLCQVGATACRICR